MCHLPAGINKVKSFIEGIRGRKDILILINNAGFGYNEFISNSNVGLLEQMVKVHINISIKTINAILPNMIKKNTGTIINVSSEGIYLPMPKNGIYSATKAFLKVYTEVLNLELMNTNIKVQALCPGLTKTDFHEKMGMDKSKQKDNKVIKMYIGV